MLRKRASATAVPARWQNAPGRVVRHVDIRAAGNAAGDIMSSSSSSWRGDAFDLFEAGCTSKLQQKVREGEFYVFHSGLADISASRYNAVGRFGRISEVATRVAGSLAKATARRSK